LGRSSEPASEGDGVSIEARSDADAVVVSFLWIAAIKPETPPETEQGGILA
jgi:hypothetical protein